MMKVLVLVLVGGLTACGGGVEDVGGCTEADVRCDDRVAENCACGGDRCELTRHRCATGAGCTTQEVSGAERALCLKIPGASCEAGASPLCRGDGAAETCNAALGRVEVYACGDEDPLAPGCAVCGS